MHMLDWLKRKGDLSAALLMGLLGAVLTFLALLVVPNSYRSEARILPTEAKTGQGLGVVGAAAAAQGM
jgi:hypothetical protein